MAMVSHIYCPAIGLRGKAMGKYTLQQTTQTKSIFTISVAILMLLPTSTALASAEVFRIWAPREGGSVLVFSSQVFKLAMEKTVDEYGPYKIETLDEMTYQRVEVYLDEENYNLILDSNATPERMLDYIYIPFPVNRGIIGYRTFFVSPESSRKMQNVKTIDDLKQFTIGQGTGWADVKILENAGFSVVTTPVYETLFKMVTLNRFDLYGRGVTELFHEYDARKRTIENLLYDKNICLYYPLPRFYFTHPSNAKGLKRLEKGLKKAYRDGSYLKLWREFYSEALNRGKLKHRTIFKIDNPLLKGIDQSYKKYIYDPLE